MGKTPEEIELEIKQARYDLAEKVDALTEQAKDAAETVKHETENVKEKVDEAKSAGLKMVAVAFVAVVGILFIKRALSKR